ncbi:uncharacterized protein DS421_19g652630 [Arachis hypogaea]|uniref:Uncharacterized protein n=1 Tax=Arachis hypogaea TaxID=3818 RepID=A0A6B9V7Q3_ARAHY|nr:uncharacterized protein DS421_19g652630 [Arachis hypogaea]
MLLRSSSTPIPTSFIPHSREPSSPEAERVLQFSRTRSFASPRQNLPDSSDHRSPTKHDNKSRIPRSNVLKSQHGTEIKESDQGSDGGKICGGSGRVPNGGGWESDKTHAYYQTMIQANPNNALLLGNYAKFLKEVRRDYPKAEEYLERAILANPGDATHMDDLVLENICDRVRKAGMMKKKQQQQQKIVQMS